MTDQWLTSSTHYCKTGVWLSFDLSFFFFFYFLWIRKKAYLDEFLGVFSGKSWDRLLLMFSVTFSLYSTVVCNSGVVLPHSFPECSPIKWHQTTTLPRPHLTLMCQPVFELATLSPPNKSSSSQRHPGDTEKGLCFSYLVDRGVFIAILMYWCKNNKHIHIQTCF